MFRLKALFFVGGLYLIPIISFGQYILNGSAVKESCNCYVLTTEDKALFGSVWQSTKIDLAQPFDYFFDVYLGCRDFDGADGIVFILQPNSTSLGSQGEGLGFQGITPSVGIPLDTYRKLDDPSYDHISIQLNGDILHKNDLAGPVPASATDNNIEDCKWHVLRIVWDPAIDSLTAYFDGNWRVGAKINLVKDVFNNDPMVFWGFSGATGGSFNVQKFCTSLDPEFETQIIENQFCLGDPIEFKNNSIGSVGISSYFWDFGDGSTSTIANPVHNYSSTGSYTVKFRFTSKDGCDSKTFTRNIIVGDIPIASLSVSDTCQSLNPVIFTSAIANIGRINQWEWQLNDQPFSTEKIPDLTSLPPGNYKLSYRAISEFGCKSNDAEDDFAVLPKPGINFSAKDACVEEVLQFNALQLDNQMVAEWHWEFDDGKFSNEKNPQHSFENRGDYSVTLAATGVNGCKAHFVQELFINSPKAVVGKDTLVLPGSLFQLQASGGVSYTWTPSTGLSNPSIANPSGNIENDIRYRVKVTTAEGCSDTASMLVTVFKGSAIYVPNAFTPNNDGLNDVLKPYFIGIKTLSFFTVYDRWGKKVFSTNNMSEGWNGLAGGRMMESDTYIWVLKAEDLIGKKYDLKGHVTLIK